MLQRVMFEQNFLMEFLVAAGLIAFELGLVVISHVQAEIFDASVLFLAVFA